VSSAGALLYAGDKAFKDELGKVLDLHVWAAGKDLVGGRVRAAERQAAAAAAAVEARARYVTRLQTQADDAAERCAAWDAQHQEATATAEERVAEAAKEAAAAADACFAAAAVLRRRLDVARGQVGDAMGVLEGPDEEASAADERIRALEERAVAMAAEHAAALQPVETRRKALDDAATDARVAEAGALQMARQTYQAVANYEQGASGA
jgi:hypothetical protein